ncbi:hypothetical protein D3C77_169110 [compost metagenome]
MTDFHLHPDEKADHLKASRSDRHGLSGTNLNPRKSIKASGLFPSISTVSIPSKKRCTPAVAGILACLYAGYIRNLAVLENLELQDMKDQARIDEVKGINISIEKIALACASDVSLPDWQRRLSADTKLAFTFLGIAQIPGAQAFTFRLGHEVANAALSARKGATDYLSALIKTLRITDLAFVLEFAEAESDENHSCHAHGIAHIPVSVSAQTILELLAPKPDPSRSPPRKGYRQRFNNKAIRIDDIQTPGGWALYSAKEIDFTAHCLQSHPDYASRSASQAGRELYEAIRVWVRS